MHTTTVQRIVPIQSGITGKSEGWIIFLEKDGEQTTEEQMTNT